VHDLITGDYQVRDNAVITECQAPGATLCFDAAGRGASPGARPAPSFLNGRILDDSKPRMRTCARDGRPRLQGGSARNGSCRNPRSWRSPDKMRFQLPLSNGTPLYHPGPERVCLHGDSVWRTFSWDPNAIQGGAESRGRPGTAEAAVQACTRAALLPPTSSPRRESR
jgi:hypothetical protein